MLRPSSPTPAEPPKAEHPKPTESSCTASPVQDDGLTWPSPLLLRGRKSVRILHRKQLYVLQLTRSGKLILTKPTA